MAWVCMGFDESDGCQAMNYDARAQECASCGAPAPPDVLLRAMGAIGFSMEEPDGNPHLNGA